MKSKGMIPCEHVMDRLWEFLDGELENGDKVAVRRHLEICNRCFPQYDFQRAYFEFTRQVRDSDTAPSELRRRLFRAILEAEKGEEEGAGESGDREGP